MSLVYGHVLLGYANYKIPNNKRQKTNKFQIPPTGVSGETITESKKGK